MECSCFTWALQLWNKVFGRIRSAFGRNTLRCQHQVVASVPNDVILDILSRLPADQAYECRIVCKEWRALISAPYFVDMNYRSRSCIMFLQSFDGPMWKWNKQINFFFDEHAEKSKMFRRFKGLSDHSLWNTCPRLVDSCEGVLLFCGDWACSRFFICNPITREQCTVRLPFPLKAICGFFFNKFTQEYCVLVYLVNIGHPYEYAIYSLKTAVWRRLEGKFKSCPLNTFAPVSVNGALHWITDAEENGRRASTPCREAIWIFNIEDESFSYRPHPGEGCSLSMLEGHYHVHMMRLLEIEDQLAFCRIYPHHISIWVLHDYANWIWVKSFKVRQNVEYWNIFGVTGCCTAMNLINIQNNELLLLSNGRMVFRYHIRRHTVRKFYVPKRLGLSFEPPTVMYTYTKSLSFLEKFAT